MTPSIEWAKLSGFKVELDSQVGVPIDAIRMALGAVMGQHTRRGHEAAQGF